MGVNGHSFVFTTVEHDPDASPLHPLSKKKQTSLCDRGIFVLYIRQRRAKDYSKIKSHIELFRIGEDLYETCDWKTRIGLVLFQHLTWTAYYANLFLKSSNLHCHSNH